MLSGHACATSLSKQASSQEALEERMQAKFLAETIARFSLLASLVVVIVGGMGSVTGAAIGALLIGLAEQFGLAYSPTYGIVYTFLIMVLALAFRPQGIMGRRI